MRAAFVLLLVPMLGAGCLDSDGDGPGGLIGGHSPPRRTEPWVVTDRGFAASNAGGSMGLDFTLDQAVDHLKLAVDFGTSAFTGFRFTEPAACAGTGAGSGVYPNSSSWNGSCDAMGAGTYHMAWTLEAGYVQGHLTVVAVP